MSLLARSLAVLLALGSVACGKRPLAEEGSVDGAAGNTGAAGSTDGTAGRSGPGGATAGASGGSIGGGATAGASGGSTGGATAGASGGSTGGGATAGSGGATAGTGGGATAGSGGSGLGPIRLVIFYTRWGTAYPEWWPTGSERDFTMSAMLQALEPHKRDLIVLSGLSNANVDSSGDTPMLRWAYVADIGGEAMISLLTARPAVADAPAQGPSLDTLVGDCGGTAGPPLRLSVGQFGYDDNPGVSFGADGAAIRGERDPRAVAMRVLGHDVNAPDPDGDIDVDYPALGIAHMNVAAEALATSKTCAVTLMWGDHVVPKSLGLTENVHLMSHRSNALYYAVSYQPPPPDPNNEFVKLQRFYAQQFASLLDRLRATPVGDGTLLDRSVVVWISESGSGSDHTGAYIPVVIAGRGGGRLDVGRFLEIKPHSPSPGQGVVDIWSITRTQGDLLAALATLWGAPTFGDPLITRQPLTEILKP